MRFLFVDRILESSRGEWIKGIKQISADDFYLSKDTNGRAYFLPSLVGETLGQLAAWNVMEANGFSLRPVAGVVEQATLCRKAFVGETLFLEAFIDRLDDASVQYHGVASVGDEPVFKLEGALGPMLPMHDFIETQEVKAQYDEINRPGDFAANKELVKSYPNAMHADTRPVMGMCFDTITEHKQGVSLTAIKRVTRQAPYFPHHFPKKPVLPMTVLLACQLDLVEQFLMHAGFNQSYQVDCLRRIKMSDFILPADVAVCHLKVKEHTDEHLILTLLTEVAGKRVCVSQVVLKAVA
jgi:3-hydroxymyristoyl/3-hydroxydecanoyl-(acyl carrier protein) dehydratase